MVGKCKRRPYDGCASGYQWAGEACPREFKCVKQKYLDYRYKRKPRSKCHKVKGSGCKSGNFWMGEDCPRKGRCVKPRYGYRG
jgi:hypothetical protein